jgi:hypothetical protein
MAAAHPLRPSLAGGPFSARDEFLAAELAVTVRIQSGEARLGAFRAHRHGPGAALIRRHRPVAVGIRGGQTLDPAFDEIGAADRTGLRGARSRTLNRLLGRGGPGRGGQGDDGEAADQ